MARLGRISALVLPAVAAALALATPAQAQYSPGFQFLKAVKEGNGDEVVKLLQDHSNTLVNSQDITTGESALHIAVSQRNMTWIQFLCQKGANTNIQDKKGVTPLVLAAQIGFIDGVQELIKRGARVDISNATGETPLIAAVHRRDIPMMRVLLKGGADPDRADSSGRSALDYAMYDGANSALVSEIEKNKKPKGEQEGAKRYGPGL